MDAHLVLDRHAPQVVALTERAVVADEVLGHEEQEMPLRARRARPGVRASTRWMMFRPGRARRR